MTSAYWDFTEVSVIALSRFCSSLSDWFTRCCRFKKTALQKSRPQIACSKRSDSGERCEVKKAMKSRGGLGREVRERCSLPHLSPSLAFIFSRSFLLRTAPHYLNAWNRLMKFVKWFIEG